MYIMNIMDDVKLSTLDILRGLGLGIIDLIFSTIDTLYDVAHKINGINFIKMLENIDNSPFTKIFNAFFILSFFVLLLFSIWKISFRILDADTEEQPLFEMVKEIVKCGFLIFSVYLIFNTSIDLSINLSNAVYNTFNPSSITIGDKMKTAYMNINESCYQEDDGKKVDKKNVDELKELLKAHDKVSSVKTMSGFEKLLRNNTLTASNVSDAGAFSYRCGIYKPGIWNDSEDYAFNYNFLFGIVMGVIFLFSIGFAVLMLGKRQLELSFLMAISPLVIATSVGRKEQRSALYQQIASLVLQAGAMMLLIGLTATMFEVIQNSQEINNLDYFTKTVAQSILYLGCAVMLMTGCTSLNRFIGENVSANSGRDAMMAMQGLAGGIFGAGATAMGVASAAKNTAVGGYRVGKGIGQLAKGTGQAAKGLYHRAAGLSSRMNSGVSRRMNNQVGKGMSQAMRGVDLQSSSNPFVRTYGRMMQAKGESTIKNATNKWDFENDSYNPNYMWNGVGLARSGINNIRNGFGGAFDSIRNIGNPHSVRYRERPKVRNVGNENDSI